MFSHLQIYDSRERLIVGCADIFLKSVAAISPRRASAAPIGTPQRILLLRLERIGDLLMTLGAIEAVRRRAPAATIHLVVGSWNASLASLVQGIDSCEILDVPWLAREGTGASTGALIKAARAWRTRHFSLALNFEPDIRSNLLLALSGAPRRAGFSSGGGGAFLTTALSYVPSDHTADNALRLVEEVLPSPSNETPSPYRRLPVPAEARQEAVRLLGDAGDGRLLVGIHASGGRAIKQWHLDRFAAVATRLARDLGAAIVLTGTGTERPLVERIMADLPADVTALNVAGSIELPVFAGLLQQLDLFVTGDTGPMHLAAALGTPVVALFGPSDPARYGPLTDKARVLTTNLWCRPCNRVRRPPARCTGRVPDCLDGIGVDQVEEAAKALLADVSAVKERLPGDA